MRKLILSAAVATFLVAAPALAKDWYVSITKAGFAPKTVTLPAGDSVTWTNKDKEKHRLVCKTCPVTSPVMKQREGFTYTFLKPGAFTFVDSANSRKIVVVVKKAPPVTVKASASPKVISYGSSSSVTGKLSTGETGQKLAMVARPCGKKSKMVGIVVTNAGAFVWHHRPAESTRLQAQYRSVNGPVASPLVPIGIRPIVTLKKSNDKFTVEVAAGRSLVGKSVLLQRSVGKKWVTVRKATLDATKTSSKPMDGTVVSSQSFTSSVKPGAQVRAMLPLVQARPCYVAATSAALKT